MSTSAFRPDTKIKYRADDGADYIVPLSDLVALYAAVDKPILVYSMARSANPNNAGKLQQAKALDINLRKIVREYATITFANGGSLICTEDTNLYIVRSSNTKNVKISDITGFSYLDVNSLSIGDRILSNNADGYLEIVNISHIVSAYVDYFGVTVPVYGNYYLEILGSDGLYTSIVAGN